MVHGRALHFVLKIGDRNASIRFFRDLLKMKVLRHEEFTEGCKASCNGPYDGRWSKTMIGYGDEDNHFVLELTYNYGINKYRMGNDFQYILIENANAYCNILKSEFPILFKSDEMLKVLSPDGYMFCICNKSSSNDPIRELVLSTTDIGLSKDYWSELIGMSVVKETQNEITFNFSQNQCLLKLVLINEQIDHASAFGRVAFSCPFSELSGLQILLDQNEKTILTRLISLDTPGKATVHVVILGDPDGHEICFVGDEGFRHLSKLDCKADELLENAMIEDKSDEWFSKHNKEKK